MVTTCPLFAKPEPMNFLIALYLLKPCKWTDIETLSLYIILWQKGVIFGTMDISFDSVTLASLSHWNPVLTSKKGIWQLKHFSSALLHHSYMEAQEKTAARFKGLFALGYRHLRVLKLTLNKHRLSRKIRRRHSTEVALALFTQLLWIRILALPRFSSLGTITTACFVKSIET